MNATIKLAPLVTEKVLGRIGSLNPGRTYYQRGSIELSADCPLIVNHDASRRVGTVRELVEFDDADGLWLLARAQVHDPPPWLEARRTAASFGFIQVECQRFRDLERVLRALVREVSILSPSVKPAEPGARVLLLLREVEPGVASTVVHQRGDVIRRPCGVVLAVR